MTFDDEHFPITHGTIWWHASVAFAGGAMSPKDAQTLSAALRDQRFHFLRKDSGLRLRTERPCATLLDRLVAERQATGWVGGIYEPETEAFGGPQGMDVAHDVFCADSRSALPETGSNGTRERCVMLLSAMIREAGLDPFEAGDVWSQFAALRPPVTPPAGPARDRSVSAMRRLMNADAALRLDAEPGWAERVAAFEDAGRRLRRLAADGRLIRGLRAVLAHHAIFAFNRAGVSAAEQAATAWLGRQYMPPVPTHLNWTPWDGVGPGAEILGDITGKRVLDIGSGAGHHAVHLAQAHGTHMTAIERSPTQHQRALGTHAEVPNVQFVLGDVVDYLRTTKLFDAAYAIGSLAFADPHRTLPALRDGLHPRAPLVLSLLHTDLHNHGPSTTVAPREQMIPLRDRPPLATQMWVLSPHLWEDLLNEYGFRVEAIDLLRHPDATVPVVQQLILAQCLPDRPQRRSSRPRTTRPPAPRRPST
ncbi:thiopeptide-type bacteriocin biosynthesis protein [Streptomyces sp. H39-C1]|uniref:thiopeptide-type bacteriocin biosynthesis protein n=1 Tax=Streptomyces sp. H39-C1 TaxID=3004355 RepID=UPI0022AF49F7|nr:thiopeptide-type bacteriocin biosynthesis protein [Streptomyces sp. H39-C1]MCZ4102542.1 thiopeptide-type bacteriocin biosynthesis protein [Streptomyces sp. H39-C1]